MMSAGVPLINDYKKKFILYRLLTTITGGLQFHSKPRYKIFLQVFVYIIPPIIYVTLRSFLTLTFPYFGIIFASLLSLYFLITVGTTHFLKDTNNIFSNKKCWLDIIFHSSVSFTFGFIISEFIDSTTLNIQTGFLTFFIWVASCNAHFALLDGSVPEPSIYRSLEPESISALTRPIHCSLTVGLYYLLWYLRWYYEWVKIFYCFMPLLWTIGVLPGLESLTLWLGEQIQIFLFGGSATTGWKRCLINLALSTTFFVVLIMTKPNTKVLLGLCTFFGYFLSLDWPGFISVLKNPPGNKIHVAEEFGVFKLSTKSYENRIVLPLKEYISHIPFITFATIIGYFGPNELPIEALGWFNVILFIVLLFHDRLQNVFIGQLKNPIYSSTEPTDRSLRKIVSYHLRALFIDILVPLYLTLYFRGLSVKIPNEHSWLSLLATIRIFRWTWQYPTLALSETVIYKIFTFAFPNVFKNSLLLMILISFSRDRLINVWEKTNFVFSLALSSLEDRASKRSYAGCLFQTNVLFSPVLLVFILVSAFFSAPIVAIFTLPVFFPSYPRHKKFWPEIVTSYGSPDAVFYRQMTSEVLSAFHRSLVSGRLCFMQPGDLFIVRQEDKICWIGILEKGNRYVYYFLKGTELVETSCHALEASRIDEIFLDSFENSKSLYDRYPLHIMKPITELYFRAYVDSKNILVGVLDREDVKELISILFVKTLIWFIIKDSNKSINFTTKNMNEENVSLEEVKIVRSPSIDGVNPESWPSSSISSEKPSKLKYRRKSTNSDISDFDFNQETFETIDPLNENYLPGEIEKLNEKNEEKKTGTILTPPPSSDWTFSAFNWPQSFILSESRKKEILESINDDWILYITKETEMSSDCNRYKKVAAKYFGLIYPYASDVKDQGLTVVSKAFDPTLSFEMIPEEIEANLIKPSLKAAIKLALDSVLLFDDIVDDYKTLESKLTEFKLNWFLGDEKDFPLAIDSGITKLFSCSEMNDRPGQFKSRLLALRETKGYLASINPQAFISLWASLNLELSFLTNDDDERYSIQAEERLLRNLSVQTADPPLGYPVHNSGPIRKSF